MLVACDSADEAHYVCAVLNSAVVNDLVLAHSVRGGKGFGTPGMLDFIPIGRFQGDDPRHAELAVLGREAHAALLLVALAKRSTKSPLPTNRPCCAWCPSVPGEGQGEGRPRATATVAEIQRQIDRLTADLWASSSVKSRP